MWRTRHAAHLVGLGKGLLLEMRAWRQFAEATCSRMETTIASTSAARVAPFIGARVGLAASARDTFGRDSSSVLDGMPGFYRNWRRSDWSRCADGS